MKTTLLICLILTASFSNAQDGGSVPVKTPPIPTLQQEGDNYVLSYPDGRKAGFFQAIGKVHQLKIKMRQIENTCDYALPLTNCEMVMSVAPRFFALKWISNPDSNKIGQVVTTTGQSVGKIQDEGRYYFWYNTLYQKDYANYFVPDQIRCNNLDWMKNVRLENNLLKIDSWTGEQMTITQETQVNENQTTTGVFSVGLKQIDSKTLEFVQFGAHNITFDIPPYIPLQVSSLTYVDKNQNQCQVSFEGDVTEITKVITSDDFKKIDPTTETRIKNATSLKGSVIQSFFKSLLRGVEVE